MRLTYEIFTSGLMRSSAGVEMLPNLTNFKGERAETCVADDTRETESVDDSGACDCQPHGDGFSTFF